MASPVIQYASTGSDTAASGAGPATALTGSSATVNGGDPGTTINLDGSPDLSAVASDGSHAIWLNTTSGTRHLSTITAVDNTNKRVTIENSMSLGGGVAWAIGGKRLTLQHDSSRVDILDASNGWVLELTTSTDFDVDYASAIPNGTIILRGASGLSPKPRIVSSLGADAFTSGNGTIFRDFRYTNDVQIYRGLATTSFGEFCLLEGIDADAVLASGQGSIRAVNCTYVGSSGQTSPVFQTSNHAFIFVDGCSFTNLYGPAIYYQKTNTSNGAYIFNSFFDGRGSVKAIDLARDALSYIIGNTFFDCVDAIDFMTGTFGYAYMNFIANNLFVACSGYAVATSGSTPEAGSITMRNNAYYQCTSGFAEGGTEFGTIALTADPFTNSASDDFTLNNNAGGGAACRSAGIPTSLYGLTNYKDNGALQVQPSAGGSGGGGKLINGGLVS